MSLIIKENAQIGVNTEMFISWTYKKLSLGAIIFKLLLSHQ